MSNDGANIAGLDIRPVLGAVAVIPVVTLDRLEDAVPMAEALVEGGLPAIEMTLRTPAGLAAIEQIAAKVKGAIVGAGTITTPADVAAAKDAGARFGVSPALFPDVVRAAAAAGLPYIPGIMTATEAMQAVALGCKVLKLFPAEPAGGIKLLKALAGPFPDLLFCPTGGIGPAQAADYLRLPNVIAIGGSWMTPAESIKTRDWNTIRKLASEASSFRGG
jgi:2-dehydro-3-deoxyphosphogluconate aldolase / (4S)-4-hydroxy-2-oxoglutarate aldolase